jgi:hypothetical protein
MSESTVDLEKTLQAALDVLRRDRDKQIAEKLEPVQETKPKTKKVALSLFIGIPTLSGLKANCVQSILAIGEECWRRKVNHRIFINDGCSLIPVARNSMAREFMKSNMSHWLMLDDDIGVNAKDVFRMIESGQHMVAGAVPMRKVNFDYLHDAVSKGKTTELYKYTQQFNIAMNSMDEHIYSDSRGLMEIKFAGTACLLVTRDAVQAMIEKGDPQDYEENGEKTWDLFDPHIEWDEKLDKNYYVGEDAAFCARYRKLGGKVYCIPDMVLTHQGPTCFSGTFKDVIDAV